VGADKNKKTRKTIDVGPNAVPKKKRPKRPAMTTQKKYGV